MTRRISADLESEIIGLYRSGQSGKMVAKHAGVSDVTVYNTLRRNGVELRPAGGHLGWRDSEQGRRELVTAYRLGESIPSLARRLHCGNRRVIKVLDDLGIERHPGGKRRFTDEQAAQFAREYADGGSLEEIGKRHGTNSMTVRGYLARQGVQLRPLGAPAFWTDQRKAEAARRYQAGDQVQAIAAALGCGTDTLSRTLREMGILKPRQWGLRGPEHHSWRGGRITDGQGYIRVKVPDEDQHLADQTRTGYMMEHRLVMARKRGHRLLPGENVHHKNGIKTDNRPGNLELWVKMQPTGQRVEDVVTWATEMLQRYAPERLTGRREPVVRRSGQHG